MPDISNQKNKISLSDYNYRRDIENRLLMAELSVFEVDVLREILNNSLKISLSDLADSLEVTPKKLIPALTKLSKTQLFTIQSDQISVDKEMRKYYESQIDKFDDDFEPGMEYLQGLLSKAPMHALLSWYSIPRTSNHIFSSIIENYLHTPKIYERYLSELRFEMPVLDEIVRDVLTSPDLKVRGRELMDRYGLSREQFEEHMLHLEFNFVCCLGYTQADEIWEEVVTPFYEWSSYVRFLRESKPQTITNVSEIQKSPPQGKNQAKSASRYSIDLCNAFSERDVRETERSLKSLVKHGWVYFDDYIKSLTAPIGNAQQVALQNKGKKWRYSLPTYSKEEIEFIKSMLFKGMFEAGLVETGTHRGKPCFCVTPSGRTVIGDERRFGCN